MPKDINPDIPRFVLTLADTHTIVQGSQGEQYMSISVAADSLAHFNKYLPKEDRSPQYKTELQKLFVYFQEQVDKANEAGNNLKQVQVKGNEL